MNALLVRAIGGVLAKRAMKSLTAWLGAAVAGTGAAAAINPEILEMIPESLRGYAIAGVGVAVVLARHRREILAVWAELKAAIRAEPAS